MAMRVNVNDPAFRSAIANLHRLGPRVLAEFLAELALYHGAKLSDDMADLLGAYEHLIPEMVEAAGADQFPPLPALRLVIGGVS